jgi:hypothetical protein
MEDLNVEKVKLVAIYEAAKVFGRRAWNQNARLKSAGEKRVLVKFPPTAAVTWCDWNEAARRLCFLTELDCH